MMKKAEKKAIQSEVVLAGDVGGTNTRLGLFEAEVAFTSYWKKLF